MSLQRRERQALRKKSQEVSAEVEYACSCTSITDLPSAHCEAHGDALKERMKVTALTESELEVFKTLASKIRDNTHLWKILSTVPEDRRQIVYEQIACFVTFKPIPPFPAN